MIPVFVLYEILGDKIESVFNGNMLLVGSMLIITALLLTFTYYKKAGNKDVGFWNSFVIGVSQAIAILPGISRSGATISTALLMGVDKEKSTEFSFLMVLIPIIGGNFLKIMDYVETPVSANTIHPSALIIGFIAAFISGLFACTWMIKIVKRGKLIYFAIYCFIIGLAAIAYSMLK